MQDVQINLWELVSPLARTFDMMSPAVAEHSQRVAYLAMRLAEEAGLPNEERRDIATAGILHDIGAFSHGEMLDLLEFEETKPMRHSTAGYLLLKDFEPLSPAASLIEFHHAPWRNGGGAIRGGKAVHIGSHVLHLADRVAVSFSGDKDILSQVPLILERFPGLKGKMFVPEHVDALLRLAGKDYIWLEMESGAMDAALRKSLEAQSAKLGIGALLEFARLLCRIIDFKSKFTATHSSGVAAVGKMLAKQAGFSGRECTMLEIAAYLHDLGKIAVPSEILEKPGKLTPAEWDVMRSHVYYTHRILGSIEAISTIASWSALHQERLNGSGYPFRYTEDDIPLGARIMAVADVFTGVTEDRPYRKGMAKDAVLEVLSEMTSRRELDGSLVKLLIENYDPVDRTRALAQARATKEYEEFRTELSRRV